MNLLPNQRLFNWTLAMIFKLNHLVVISFNNNLSNNWGNYEKFEGTFQETNMCGWEHIVEFKCYEYFEFISKKIASLLTKTFSPYWGGRESNSTIFSWNLFNFERKNQFFENKLLKAWNFEAEKLLTTVFFCHNK